MIRFIFYFWLSDKKLNDTLLFRDFEFPDIAYSRITILNQGLFRVGQAKHCSDTPEGSYKI